MSPESGGVIQIRRLLLSFFKLDQPDIAVADAVAVVLQLQRTGGRVRRRLSGLVAGGCPFDRDVVLHLDAVVLHRDAGLFLDRAVGVHARGTEGDIVGLPLFGGQAGIDLGPSLAVNRGAIAGDKLVADPGYYGLGVELRKTMRKSPSEGAQPPAEAAVLLPFSPGKAPDISAWNGGPWKPQDDGSLQCDPSKGSITTKRSFGDIKLHVEFWLPLMADSFGQGRANSGVIINNIYEIQVLDSFEIGRAHV